MSFPDLGKEIETKLNFTSRYIDPTNRTFKVECKISSKDVELRANMIAYLKIKDYTNEKAFCLPVNYIQVTRMASLYMLPNKTVRTGLPKAEHQNRKGLQWNH